LEVHIPSIPCIPWVHNSHAHGKTYSRVRCCMP
jgi:hypothetical protein